MKRNYGLDVIRVFALFSVLVYHFYVLTGEQAYAGIPALHNLIETGGEIGVTLFFILSGYGIYTSIDYQMSKGTFSYKNYMKKRCKRILPQYYLSLLILLFIGNQAYMLSNAGAFSILTHALLIHNWFPSTAGSISTVLWTQGAIFQFYIVAVFLYKAVKKNPHLSMIGSIAVTVLSKFVIFHLIFPHFDVQSSYYFVYGRQLISALDNFVIGMYLAEISKNIRLEGCKKHILFAGVLFVSFVWCIMPQSYLRYNDQFYGYIWHSVLNILLGMIVWYMSSMSWKTDRKLAKGISFVAKYQYGTFLWHFVIASNLLSSSQWIAGISHISFTLVAVILCICSVIVGYVSTLALETPLFQLGNKK